MENPKKFMIETHTARGELIDRRLTEIENSPAYGEVACQQILSNRPEVYSVSILEMDLIDGKHAAMVDEHGNQLKDGAGNTRMSYTERMRFTRHVNNQTFGKAMENWNG